MSFNAKADEGIICIFKDGKNVPAGKDTKWEVRTQYRHKNCLGCLHRLGPHEHNHPIILKGCSVSSPNEEHVDLSYQYIAYQYFQLPDPEDEDGH